MRGALGIKQPNARVHWKKFAHRCIMRMIENSFAVGVMQKGNCTTLTA